MSHSSDQGRSSRGPSSPSPRDCPTALPKGLRRGHPANAVTWDGEGKVEQFDTTQSCKVNHRSWFAGLGCYDKKDNSLEVSKTLLTGICLISKHIE